MFLNHINIQRKLLSLVTVMFVGVVVAAVSFLVFYRYDLLAARQAEVESVVQAASHQIAKLAEQQGAGQISGAEFERRAADIIKLTRFNGGEYLYLFDRSGHFVTHPIRPEMAGRDMREFQDRFGHYLFRDMLAELETRSSLSWEYYWPSPGQDTPVRKLGFAQRVPGTDWVVGSGIYLDSVGKIFIARSFSYAMLIIALLAVILPLAVRIAKSISQPIIHMSSQMRLLAAGDLDNEVQGTERCDEIGQMAQSVRVFRDQAIENNRLRTLGEQARFLETFDPVTRLYNRNALGEALKREISRHRPGQEQICVMVIRVDMLRDINREWGAAQRDNVLITLCQRIRAELLMDDILARHSEDTLVLVRPHIGETAQVTALVEQVQAVVSQPIPTGQEPLSLYARLGISLYPDDSEQEFQLIGQAEEAMREARRQERRWLCYGDVNHELLDHRVQLWNDLQRAIDEDQFTLHFQPIFDTHNGHLMSAEVLLRWTHPSRGPVSPATFIPFAEHSGLIAQLDAWVFDAVAKQCNHWQHSGLPVPSLALNLSGISFMRQDFEQLVDDIAVRHGVALEHFELELTEGVLIEDLDILQSRIKAIRRKGLRLSIDDFGTGYSSLSRIRVLDIDKIKVDRSFIDDLSQSEQDRRIVASIINMAHGMQLQVVAEGIETREQLAILRQARCDLVQGFFLGRPMPAAKFEQLMQQQETSALA